jgi:hypothetical protein
MFPGDVSDHQISTRQKKTPASILVGVFYVNLVSMTKFTKLPLEKQI